MGGHLDFEEMNIGNTTIDNARYEVSKVLDKFKKMLLKEDIDTEFLKQFEIIMVPAASNLHFSYNSENLNINLGENCRVTKVYDLIYNIIENQHTQTVFDNFGLDINWLKKFSDKDIHYLDNLNYPKYGNSSLVTIHITNKKAIQFLNFDYFTLPEMIDLNASDVDTLNDKVQSLADNFIEIVDSKREVLKALHWLKQELIKLNDANDFNLALLSRDVVIWEILFKLICFHSYHKKTLLLKSDCVPLILSAEPIGKILFELRNSDYVWEQYEHDKFKVLSNQYISSLLEDCCHAKKHIDLALLEKFWGYYNVKTRTVRFHKNKDYLVFDGVTYNF